MAAVPPAGRELCPHCRRPFKRLRAHLPHCKAAPSPVPRSAPGTGPNSGPGSGPAPAAAAPGPLPGLGPSPGPAGKSNKRPSGPRAGQGLPGAAPREPAAAQKGKKAAAEKGGGGTGSGPRRQPDGRRAEREVEPAVRDVAKCLDLLPEEVKDLPAKLSNGVKIVIEKHRARVVREKSRSGSTPAGSPSTLRLPEEGPDPGRASDAAQPDPGEGRAVPAAANTETRGLGAAEPASASSEGEKGGSLKARKTPVLGDLPEADSRSSLAKEASRGKNVTEEEQMHLEAGVEYKASLSALHTKILHLSAIEGFGGHKEGTSKSDLTGAQKLREREQQMATLSEPILNARRERELALPLSLLHTSKNQPICLYQAPGRSTAAGAMGMEWFPDLYPNYRGLSIFPGKPFHENEGITVKTPKGSFSEGHQGPLLERRLMDVRLGELPMWLVTCDFSPQGLLGGVQKAWSSYYNKYINVKRGGPAGISMLLTGYCLLSYGWSYQHIKRHRWRKYH